MRNKDRFTLMTSGAVLCLILAAPAGAHEYQAGNIVVDHPWLRTPGEGQSTAPLYMVIRNTGDAAERLTGAASDKVGGSVVHGDPNNIVYPPAIVIPPHGEIMLAPGGAFVGLHEVRKMNPVGWGFELDLVFEKAGRLPIEAAVEAPDAAHAHDAEAMARWEKAHGAPVEAAPAAHHHHDAAEVEHHHHGPAAGAHEHGAGGGKTLDEVAREADAAAEAAPVPETPHDDAAAAEPPQDDALAAGEAMPPETDEGQDISDALQALDAGAAGDPSLDPRYEAERNSMDHSKQNFGVPGIPPKGAARE